MGRDREVRQGFGDAKEILGSIGIGEVAFELSVPTQSWVVRVTLWEIFHEFVLIGEEAADGFGQAPSFLLHSKRRKGSSKHHFACLLAAAPETRAIGLGVFGGKLGRDKPFPKRKFWASSCLGGLFGDKRKVCEDDTICRRKDTICRRNTLMQ